MTPISQQSYNQNFNPNRVWFWLLILTVVIAIGFNSCKPSLETKIKHYQKVAQDIQPISETKKALLAGVVAANFPNKEKIVEKEVTKVIVDTSQYSKFREYIKQLNLQLSVANCPQLNVDSIFKVARETIKPDIIKTEKVRETTIVDTVGNFLLNRKLSEYQSLIAQKEAEIAHKEQQRKDAVVDKENAEHSRNKLIWWLAGVSLFLIVSHYVRSNFKIPFL